MSAEAYAKRAGKRLSTEAEFEFAARGGLNARFVHEFENSKRPEGDLFHFSATLKF